MSGYRTKAGFNYSQPNFRDDMDLWGESKGDEVWEGERKVSKLLGPNGEKLEYVKQPIGFCLRPRGRK